MQRYFGGCRIYGPNRACSWPYIRMGGARIKIAGDPSEPFIGALYDGHELATLLFGTIVDGPKREGILTPPTFLNESL